MQINWYTLSMNLFKYEQVDKNKKLNELKIKNISRKKYQVLMC